MSRDAKDFAVEFGRYLVTVANAHLDFMERCRIESKVERFAFITKSARLKQAAQAFGAIAPATPTQDAAAKDAAIALARELAQVATAYLDLVARCKVDSSDPDGFSDHFAGLRSAVYEFEKRALKAEMGIA